MEILLEHPVFFSKNHLFLLQTHLSCVFIDSLMKTSVIIRAQMSQKLYEHLFANLALFEFPALSESRCWLIDSGTASQQQQKRVKRHVTYHWPVSGLKTWSWKPWQPCFASLSSSVDLITKAAKIEVNMSLGTLISRPREKFVKWQRTLVHTLGDPCVLTNFLSK